MKAPAFDYEKPATLDAALALLADDTGDTKVLAGGQSLGPLLNLRLARPGRLVDVRSLAELTACHEASDTVTLGAGTTHASIEDGRVPDPTRGLLPFVAHGIAYRAVRNRGTLGGSLAHADPAADWVSAMALLDAVLIVASARGMRETPAATFVDGPLSTTLAPDELIVAVRVPQLSPSARWSYRKFNRKPGEFAEAIAGFVHDPARGVCRAVIGVTSGAPVVIPDARSMVEGDVARIDAEVGRAGFAAGSYEHQVHRVMLARAREALVA